MFAKATHLIADTPLFIRVVCLYVMTWACFGLTTLGSDQPVAATQNLPVVSKPIVEEKKIISGHPKKLSIKRLSVTLSVVDGTYDPSTGAWTLSDDKAQFAVITREPNDRSGTTFIYGHNTLAVFEPLINLKPNDVLTLQTSNKHTFTYRYVKDKLITPEDTTVLTKPSKRPQLVLMTCNGIWSENRRLVYFDFVEAR